MNYHIYDFFAQGQSISTVIFILQVNQSVIDFTATELITSYHLH